MKDADRLMNPGAEPEYDGDGSWPEEALPLLPVLTEPEPFPMEALGSPLAECGQMVCRTMQAPDGIVAGGLLAGAAVASQALADVVLPHGQRAPLVLFLVSVAASGERKSAVDNLLLRPHVAFEKAKHEKYLDALNAFKALPKGERDTAEQPKAPVFLTGDPTIEGLTKMLAGGLPSVAVASGEGGRFVGGHGMTDENQLRTGAGLAILWDGGALDRVRAGEGAYKLFGRRVSMHIMLQPLAAMNWLGNKTLRDQGLFSRTLIGYPQSTAGTRFFKDERPDATPEYQAYYAALERLLAIPWSTNELGELQPRVLTFTEGARQMWIKLHDEVERNIPGALACVRPFASKAAEHAARIAGVLQMVSDPECSQVDEETFARGATVMQWYLSEALRLASSQPVTEAADRAALMWDWLAGRGKRVVCMSELVQYGPAKLRKAKDARDAMAYLADHYRVRIHPEPIEWNGRPRKEAWEVRL